MVLQHSLLFQLPSLPTRMNTGDFYITRHSNLSEIHVVFHLVVDDSLQGEISSRHPVIIACRNVIKTAFHNDITTLTLPLFLVHEMTEVTSKCLSYLIWTYSKVISNINLGNDNSMVPKKGRTYLQMY